MLQRLPTIAVAGLLCAFAYLLATGIAVPQAATGRAMFIVSTVSLFVSVVATVIALSALARAALMRSRLERLTKSVDKAFSTFVADREREAVENDERDARLIEQLGQIDRLLSGLPDAAAVQAAPDGATAAAPDGPPQAAPDGPPQAAPAAPPQAANVVLHPAARRQIPVRRKEEAVKPHVASLGRALDTATGSIHLRPIVSTADGTVAGFDAARTGHAAIVLPSPVQARSHSAAHADGLDLDIVAVAVEAVSDELSAGRQPLPVHAAIDSSLLDDRERLSTLLALLQSQPKAARSIVLSLPIASMVAPGALATGLARLAVAGVRFSSEGWPGSEAEIEALWRSGVTFLRLPAARLLAGDTVRGQKPGVALPAMLKARGIKAIAVEAEPHEDAAALLDLGIELVVMARSPIAGASTANGHDATLRPV